MANKLRLPTAFASSALRLHTHEITCPAVYSAGTGNPNSGIYACAASALPIELVFPTSKVADTWLKDTATPWPSSASFPSPSRWSSHPGLCASLGTIAWFCLSDVFPDFHDLPPYSGQWIFIEHWCYIRPHIGCRVQGLKDKLPLLRQEYLGFLHFKQCYDSTEKTGVKMTVLLCSPSGSTN